jgi:hypothetical protein
MRSLEAPHQHQAHPPGEICSRILDGTKPSPPDFTNPYHKSASPGKGVRLFLVILLVMFCAKHPNFITELPVIRKNQ